ncbi:Prephenate and/or arogenate dehydrogenase (unknown specificity) [hydrothermal vent metagenome]|uniref:Prephenate/arogenate dehydrogenase domain-containing protein n=1 Tax=hydrothermal vent metagenome TaxID=652676 RepID=A0A1W1E4X8_9ZZZZ
MKKIEKICIIGVGLIGGSFALGLKKVDKNQIIIGYGRHEASLKQAQKLGAIDNYSMDIAEALSGVDMVLIATPVNSFKAILELIKPHLNAKVIISDVGSTKGSVMTMAKTVFSTMPEYFIPAHPIAGKEQSGVGAADGALFENKRVILTPAENANSQAIVAVRNLWSSMGATVEMLDAKTHDNLLAMTSHLPHMLAFSLMDYLMKSDPNALNYAAGGFKDFSRIASSDASMWRDICINNSEDIVKHIEGYQQTLEAVSNLIKNNQAEALEQLFQATKTTRDNWLKG